MEQTASSTTQKDEAIKISMIASLPPVQSAIQIDGQGDGAQIKLDVSREFMGEILKLQVLAGKRLRVMIEEDPDTEFVRADP